MFSRRLKKESVKREVITEALHGIIDSPMKRTLTLAPKAVTFTELYLDFFRGAILDNVFVKRFEN